MCEAINKEVDKLHLDDFAEWWQGHLPLLACQGAMLVIPQVDRLVKLGYAGMSSMSTAAKGADVQATTGNRAA